MNQSTICILTPAPGYYEDWSVPKGHYEKLLGPDLELRSWTDPGDLSGFSLILPLLAWGYQRDCPAWFALLDKLEGLPVANPPSVLRWNTDKIYLRDLSDADVAIVPTKTVQALTEQELRKSYDWAGFDRIVVKPRISGGADGTHLLKRGDPLPEAVKGKPMLIQPYVPFIAEEGEFSLFYFGGEYSHAIVKRPADGDFRVQEQFGGREQTVEPEGRAKELAQDALAAARRIHGIENLVYARVDMIRDWDGSFMLMELELIEPSLFLHHSTDEGAAFAKAVQNAA